MTLFFLSLSFLIGIYLGSLQQVDLPVMALVGLLPLAIAILWRKNGYVRLPALCLVAVLAGVARYQIALPPPDSASIAMHVGPRPVEIGGIVSAEPDIRDEDIRLVVKTYHIGSGQDSYPVAGAIQVRVARYTTYRYGDNLLLKGVLQEPPEYDTFSYKRYLLRQGIYAIMYRPQVEIIARDQGNHLLAALYTFKQRLQRSLMIYVPEPQSGLAQGILLGVRAVIADDLKEDLQRTGLTHIVVVSGYNLVVVATVLQSLTEKRLRHSVALILALGGVTLFALMVGATIPVARAAVMVSMALIARAVGRESDSLTALMFTAALLVGVSPLALWDVSFQLSFLATVGLVLLAPTLERGLRRLPWGTGAIIATTIAAGLMTLPVIAFNFNRISLITPLANLLVLPAIPPMMLAGAITAFAGLSGHVAAQIPGWLTWLLGTYTVQVTHRLSGLPWASVDIPWLDAGRQVAAIAVYFAVIALVFFVAEQAAAGGLARLRGRLPERWRRFWPYLLVVTLAAVVGVVVLAVWLILKPA